jgi:GT2 family glycosyltransferase
MITNPVPATIDGLENETATQTAHLDVVILSWQRAEMTLATITNILGQEEVAVDIYVVDQGSDEATLSQLRNALRSRPNCHLIELGKNVGVPGGRNIGMQRGSAPWLVIIDNDAEFDSCHALKMVVERFRADPQLAVIGFRVRNHFTGQDDELSWAYPASLKVKRDSEFLATRFVGAGHALRRDAYEATRGYDDSLFFYWEELDLSYQLINLGYRLVYYPRIVVRHKVSPEARVHWQQGRYYYLVRNAIYLKYKFSRDVWQCLLLAAGYLVKGWTNKLTGQALRAVRDAIPMCWRSDASTCLNRDARVYIRTHETKYRGSFWQRCWREVFSRLPGTD